MTAATSVRPDPARFQAGAAAAGAAAVVAGVALVGPDLPAGLSLCPTHAFLGIDCPACGATRGLHALVTGDVAGALSHNVLLVVVVPLLVLWWAGQVRAAAGGRPIGFPRLRRTIWTVAVGLVAVFALARNLALPGLAWLDAA